MRYHFKCFLNTNLNQHRTGTKSERKTMKIKWKLRLYSKRTKLLQGIAVWIIYIWDSFWRRTHLESEIQCVVSHTKYADRAHTIHSRDTTRYSSAYIYIYIPDIQRYTQSCDDKHGYDQSTTISCTERIFFNVLFIWHGKAFLRVLFCLVGKKPNWNKRHALSFCRRIPARQDEHEHEHEDEDEEDATAQ